jgi:myo-inositol-1-phosphate synthase
MINVGIIGAGNCASSLYQGLFYYLNNHSDGLLRDNIGGYEIKDINVSCCFDIDSRKVGKCLWDGLKSKPNCTPIFIDDVANGPIIEMGHVLDGVSKMMEEYSDDESFVVSDNSPCDVVKILRETKTDILINYLPVGSQKATEYYAQCCLDAGVPFLNCIPIFIASNKEWEQKFIDNNLPLIGDDMKSQFGASILSQMLQELAFERGIKVNAHIQRNVGGNTDFLNMMDKERIKTKKISKENVIKSQHTIRNLDTDSTFIHAGPSEYISYHKDNKIANLTLEMEGFLGAPITFEGRLSVIDSPNSAGVVIDAIRYLKVAHELGLKGSLRGPSAFTQKTPPQQMTMRDAVEECNQLSKRKINTEINKLV